MGSKPADGVPRASDTTPLPPGTHPFEPATKGRPLTHLTQDIAARGTRPANAALIWSAGSVIAVTAVWCVFWLPYFLFQWPIALLSWFWIAVAWLPPAGAAVVALVLALRAISWSEPRTTAHRRGVWALCLALSVLLLSPITLWWGTAPLVHHHLQASAPTTRYLTLTSEETDIPNCTPGTVVMVEDLDTERRPDCHPAAGVLVFPDGTELEINEWSGGGGGITPDGHYSWMDVGIYGLVAATYQEGCSDYQEWGRNEARDRIRDAFGADPGSWTCD